MNKVMKLIEKDALESILRGLWKEDDGKNSEHRICYNKALQDVQCEIDTLEVKEVDNFLTPFISFKDMVNIQYPSVNDGIKAHAEIYSFNIESELFNQLTPEQQKLWRKEIEQACISGGDAGVELARDPRYKENLEVKEVNSNDAFIEKACVWIKENITNNPKCNRIISKEGVITMGLLIKNFRKYMKGE